MSNGRVRTPSSGLRSGAVPGITFRRLVRSDFPVLGRWLAQPHVARWWHHEPTSAAVERDFGPLVDGLEPCEGFVVEQGEAPMGFVQRLRYADYPDYAAEVAPLVALPADAASIDYFVGEPTLVGRGVGTAMIVAFAARTFDEWPDVSCLVVPVVSANVASWRALQAAGFRLAARGNLEPDNPIDDPLHEIMRLDR
jgi:aminoglycoside 6'-N-acetyltransferase